MKATLLQQAQPTRPQMKERKSRRSCLRAPARAPLPIRSYCKELSAKASREMVPADSARTDWFPEILRVKAAQAGRAPAEDAVDREEDKAALADPAALAELRAECSGAEEVVVAPPVAVGAAD